MSIIAEVELREGFVLAYSMGRVMRWGIARNVLSGMIIVSSVGIYNLELRREI